MAQVGIVILSASPQGLWSATQPDNPAVLRLAAVSQEGLYRSGDCKFDFDRGEARRRLSDAAWGPDTFITEGFRSSS